MNDYETRALLYCQGEQCNAVFSTQVNTRLKGDAASLPAALEAHRTGWLVAEGQILCPDCARRLKARPH